MNVKNITYYASKKKIIDNISFNMNDFSFLLITGGNGSGKSTLLKILVGIIKPTSGEVSNQFSLAYVPDSSETYFVGLSPKIYFNFLRLELHLSQEDFNNKLNELMINLNFSEELMNREIKSLSLGEKKKTMLIGAFLINPDLYIMDEPLSGLDTDSLENLMIIIEKERIKNKKFIISSHDNLSLLSNVDYKINLKG